MPSPVAVRLPSLLLLLAASLLAAGAARAQPASSQRELDDSFDFSLGGRGARTRRSPPPAGLRLGPLPGGEAREFTLPGEPEVPGGDGVIPDGALYGAELQPEMAGEVPGVTPPVPGEPVAPAPAAPSNEPSGIYTVASGQGMGHVAQALKQAMEQAPEDFRIPEIWVPPSGGRVGLPHVIACYNHREPDDWKMRIDQEVALPPLAAVWPMIDHLKRESSCPDEPRVPRAEAPRLEPAPGMEDFVAGGGYMVESGYAYSHYGAAAQRELARLLPEGSVPPLYPVPGDYGLLQLMACWNTGSSEDLIARAGRLLQVPPPIAIPEALTFLRENQGACPPGFRPLDSRR